MKTPNEAQMKILRCLVANKHRLTYMGKHGEWYANWNGTVESFGWYVPTPRAPNVKSVDILIANNYVEKINEHNSGGAWLHWDVVLTDAGREAVAEAERNSQVS